MDAVRDVMQDAAFALVEGPSVQEGDVDWEEAAVVGGEDDRNGGEDLDEEEEDGGLTAYAAGAANAEQVLNSGCCHRLPSMSTAVAAYSRIPREQTFADVEARHSAQPHFPDMENVIVWCAFTPQGSSRGGELP